MQTRLIKIRMKNRGSAILISRSIIVRQIMYAHLNTYVADRAHRAHRAFFPYIFDPLTRAARRARHREKLKYCNAARPFSPAVTIEDTFEKKSERGGREDIRCPSDPGTIHRGWRKGVVGWKKQEAGGCRTTSGGIKLIPACVAHQWPQTNRQSDFMLWPVSRWQPTSAAMVTPLAHSGALIHKRVLYGRADAAAKAPRLR